MRHESNKTLREILFELHYAKTGLMILVIVIRKEGLAGLAPTQPKLLLV